MRQRSGTTNRVILFLFVFFLVGFSALTLYSLVDDVLAKRVLPQFRTVHAFSRGLYLFIAYFIPIQAAAVMLGYAMLFRSAEVTKAPFHSLVAGTVVLLIILTAAYILLDNMALPVLERRIQNQRILSVAAGEQLASARVSEAEGDLVAAIRSYDLYLEIGGGNEEIERRREELQAQLIAKRPESPPAAAAIEKPEREMEYDPAKLVLKSAEYLEEEDFLNAHYFASLALRLDEANGQAKILLDRAWDKLTSYSLKDQEKEAARIFDTKVQGLSALEKEDYIAAYYTFKSLERESPPEAPVDPELTEFLNRSLIGMRGISFFLSEALSGRALPGVDDLLFINPAEDGSKEIVHVGTMTTGNGNTYFYDIEAMRLTTGNELEAHFQAPYGKLIGLHINMNCRDRDRAEETYLPVYREGRTPETGPIIALDLEEPRNLRYLPVLRSETARLNTLNIYDLWKLRGPYERAGYDPKIVETRILDRILRPFLLLIFSILSIAMGWAYRTRYLSRPPIATFLLFPALPLVLTVVTELFLQAHEVFLGFLLTTLDFTFAAVILLLIEALLLILSLFLLSGQMSEA